MAEAATGLPWDALGAPPPIAMQPPAPTTPAAPSPAPAPTAPSATAPQAAAAPDPLAAVMSKISSGESGGDDNARYGFPDLPGAPGPQGESHALRKYQFEPQTWIAAAKAYQSAHPGSPAPNFNNPADEERVTRGWAIRTYGVDKNGHTLPEAAAAGDVDYARLAGQWPSLAPHSLQAQWGSLTPEEQALQHQRTTETQELQGRLTKQLQDATAFAMAKPEGSKERDEAVADLRRDNAEMMHEWREKIMTPPIAKPMDAWQNMGNAGFILAALAGLFSRQHITAGLAAAGNALNAINQNSHEEFKRQYEIWKDQVQLGSQMISMENQDIRNLLEDKKMDFDEKQAQVGTLLKSMGLEAQIGQMGINNVDKAQSLLLQRDQLNMRLMGFAQQVQLHQAQIEKDQAQADLARAKLTGGTTSYEASKTLEVLDKDGNVVREVLARESRDKAGWIDSQSGKPIELKSGESLKQITPSTAGGGRAGSQVLRQTIAGREVLSDLQNVSSMPVGSTTGLFGQVEPGTSVMEAPRNMLVRHLTSQDAQLMQASMANMTRELSILMSPVYGGNWAAKQIDPLIPVTGDTLQTTIFKLSRLAQTADNALEAIQKSPILSNDQKQYAKELRSSIQTAIPWTSSQAMEFARRGEGGESFGDFVKREGVGHSQMPEIGEVRDGYKFTGGDPANPVSWQKQ